MSGGASNWDDRFECAELSDVGMRRANNQDSKKVCFASDLASWSDHGHLFMVADGMGAHAAGELASKLAVDGISHLYFKYSEFPPEEALRMAVLETNSEVHRRGQANSDFRNMGTTASMLLLLPQGALLAHIGDSRVYRLRKDLLEQLTFDHSLVWELRDAGQLTKNGDLAQSIPKNVITRSLGPNASVDVDIEGPLPIELGDVFLLCSDGLTGKVEDDELASILKHLPPVEAASLLVDLANLRGGPDNITVVLIKVVKPLKTDVNAAQQSRASAERRRAVSPAVWVGCAVCLLIALVLVITHRYYAALAAVGAGALFLLFEAVSRQWRVSGVLRHRGKRFGKGPYTATRCPSQKVAAGLLARITQNLRQCDPGESITLNWSSFDASCETAAEAEAAGRREEAIRLCAQAIRELMDQVRKHRNQSNSGIDF